MKFLILLLLVAAPILPAQQNDIDQSSELIIVPAGDKFLTWQGKSGRSYFIQAADPNNPLAKWFWTPIIEAGNDAPISYEVGGTADKGFFRLKYTDQRFGYGESLETADFDNDGISNLDEISPPLSFSALAPTDPLSADTDGDGMTDGPERTNGFDPTNSDENNNNIPDGSDDDDVDGTTNAVETTLGSDPKTKSPVDQAIQSFANKKFFVIPLATPPATGVSRYSVETITDTGEVYYNQVFHPSGNPDDYNNLVITSHLWKNGLVTAAPSNSPNRGGYHAYSQTLPDPGASDQFAARTRVNIANTWQAGLTIFDQPSFGDVVDVQYQAWSDALGERVIPVHDRSYLSDSLLNAKFLEDGTAYAEVRQSRIFEDDYWDESGQPRTSQTDGFSVAQWYYWGLSGSIPQIVSGAATLSDNYIDHKANFISAVGGLGQDGFCIITESVDWNTTGITLRGKNGSLIDLTASGFDKYAPIATSRNGHVAERKSSGGIVYQFPGGGTESLPAAFRRNGAGYHIQVNDYGDILTYDQLVSSTAGPDIFGRKFTDPASGKTSRATCRITDTSISPDWSGVDVHALGNTMSHAKQQSLTSPAYPLAPDKTPLPMLGGTAFKGGVQFPVLLIHADMAVDANRDGVIHFSGNQNDPSLEDSPLDVTSPSQPFTFWCNEDSDGTPMDDAENPNSSTKDYEDKTIMSRRDLEDFSRIWIHFGSLQDEIAAGRLLVGLKWKNTTGSPSVNVYEHMETDGGTQYLTNNTIAAQQAPAITLRTVIPDKDNHQVSVGPTNTFIFTPDFWSGLSQENPTKYLLFEGCTEGKGQLVVTFHYPNGAEIAEGPGVWLDLKGIKKMYQRSDGDQFAGASWDETNDTLIFVHGWRMSPVGRSEFAESFYKRLWHRGFKGRFAAYQWNTFYSEDWQLLPFVGGAIDAYLSKYNDSEHAAWQSAAGLKTFVDSLPGARKHIAAHSMGNIVTGEAIRLGMNVQDYTLMQAAVPSACYDDDETRVRQTATYSHTVKLFGFSFSLPVTMWDNVTPDNDPDPATHALAYRGRFLQANHINVNMVSFFLPPDYATFLPWEVNNDQTKPENGALAEKFHYDRNGASGEKLYKYETDVTYDDFGNATVTETLDHYLTDPYEAMPYACHTWGKAQGAQFSSQGSIDGNVDLRLPQYSLPGQDPNKPGFGDQHSGQFNAKIQDLKTFYDELLDQFVISRNP